MVFHTVVLLSHNLALTVKLNLSLGRTCVSVFSEERPSAPGQAGWWSGRWRTSFSWLTWRRWFLAATGEQLRPRVFLIDWLILFILNIQKENRTQQWNKKPKNIEFEKRIYFLCTPHLSVLGPAVFVLHSLTWTDAHLHRQLITVLSGPVVDSFDREFRILFAASSPVSETWRGVGSPAEVTHQLKDFSNLKFQQHLPLESDITSPPSPPTDCLLDWEAMGVLQRVAGQPASPCLQHEEILLLDAPMQNKGMFEEKTAPAAEVFPYNGNKFVEKRYLNPSDFHNSVSKGLCENTFVCLCIFQVAWKVVSSDKRCAWEVNTFQVSQFWHENNSSSAFCLLFFLHSIWFVFAFVATRSLFQPACPSLKEWKGKSCIINDSRRKENAGKEWWCFLL